MANIITISGYEEHTVGSDYITLSMIIWQRWSRHMPGLLELTMETNRDIEDAGTVLPLGTIVRLPIPTRREEEELEAIALF